MRDDGFYDMLRRRAERYVADGGTFPVVGENAYGEHTVLYEGRDSSGQPFYTVKTLQHNGFIRVNTYYADESTEETFEH